MMLETWTEPVVDEKGRPENTKDDYIKPIVGRYTYMGIEVFWS